MSKDKFFHKVLHKICLSRMRMLRARDLKESAKRESERELKDSQKTAKETDG